MTDDLLLAFLSDTLAMWGVAGTVEGGEAPVVALIRTQNGTLVWIERAGADIPFRWFARWRVASDAEDAAHRRPCASLVGLLSALRRALDVDRGQRRACRARMIPVSVITGFLGSGKTTLLAHLLRDPAMGRTAVIMNELGEIGLDHDLIETSDESFVQLSTGCLCCKVRSDLVLTLGDLAVRRAAGTVPPFERVVIETTGLADPAPILHALITDRDLCEIYALDGVVTTVDAVNALGTLEQHDEAVRQAAVADRIIVTKSDLSEARTDEVAARIAHINPGAQVLNVVSGAIAPAALFGGGFNATTKNADVRAWLADEEIGKERHGHHRGDIASFCIVRDAPLHAATLALLISALAENCGPDLLRVKGIVHVRESPERPAVIHGVQHVYHAPVWLERWPSEDRRTRMVFIGRSVRESWVRALIDLTEAEVMDETARLTAEARQ